MDSVNQTHSLRKAVSRFALGFAAELGFPTGGFWLCRRKSEGQRNPYVAREGHLRPPEEWQLLCRRSLDPQHGGDNRDHYEEKGSHPPLWEELDSTRWEYLSAPFVLPITLKQWPARYPGALNPASTPPNIVVDRDIKECRRRLNGLLLDPELTAAEMDKDLHELRDTLYYLVRGEI